ncbi:COP9 signalosome complex subunit 8 [Teleopsis dalmanni]|uniref:COP9 signalosome complex subunit 8 n=1 Tax=Teleopsis dalmanni TaxID=139649 RepID=UPI0018CFCD9F|nr:COP9 signalosome complex subunit 8 [Teleopsis dalmanni]
MMCDMNYSKFSDLIAKLEVDEAENPDFDVGLYIRLMALYMYEDNLHAANFLWKRIPEPIKENEDLQRTYLMLVSLLSGNTGEFFKTVTHAWTPDLANIMEDLLIKKRENVFKLISRSYNGIYEQNLMELVQMPRDRLNETCNALGWVYEREGQQFIIRPKVMPSVHTDYSDTYDRFYYLTEFVSYLEN